MATIGDLQRLDLRVGRIVEAADLPGAHRPSYRLLIDFGPLGSRRSVAALKLDYAAAELAGRQVVCVFNLPPRRVAGVLSEVLVLAAAQPGEPLRLLRPEPEAAPGSPIA